MSKLTITEALQEIKTIQKRLEAKRNNLFQYLARDSRARDPFEKEGGSEKYIRQEFQAISDLEIRIISIRTAIQTSNLANQVVIDGTTHSVAEWLTWRREIHQGQKTYVTQVLANIKKVREQVLQKGGKVIGAAVAINETYSANDLPQVVVNVNESELMKEQDRLENLIGTLDGRLSLFNATTTIDV